MEGSLVIVFLSLLFKILFLSLCFDILMWSGLLGLSVCFLPYIRGVFSPFLLLLLVSLVQMLVC